VVGVPADEEAGEDEVKAFIVAREGMQVGPGEIIEWAQARMPPFLVPRFIEFIDALPVTPNGKVQKAKLRSLPQGDGVYDRLGPRTPARP
jgi:crotonobetaine/carnitine-CoA ligase